MNVGRSYNLSDNEINRQIMKRCHFPPKLKQIKNQIKLFTAELQLWYLYCNKY